MPSPPIPRRCPRIVLHPWKSCWWSAVQQSLLLAPPPCSMPSPGGAAVARREQRMTGGADPWWSQQGSSPTRNSWPSSISFTPCLLLRTGEGDSREMAQGRGIDAFVLNAVERGAAVDLVSIPVHSLRSLSPGAASGILPPPGEVSSFFLLFVSPSRSIYVCCCREKKTSCRPSLLEVRCRQR